jgi:hypothetical protein
MIFHHNIIRRVLEQFFGEVDLVRRQKCGTTKKRDDSTQVETALSNSVPSAFRFDIM